MGFSIFFFFFNDTATTEIYTLSLHDALPICLPSGDHVGFPSSEPSDLSAATLTGSVPSECTTHSSRPKKPLGDTSMRLNAMCAPSGDNDPPEPSCTNRRGEPPNTEILHKLAFKGCSSRETSK